MDQVTGGCLCGAVRLTATGKPYRVGLCHCLDCRKHHGALFYAAAMFPEDAVAIEARSVAGGLEATSIQSSGPRIDLRAQDGKPLWHPKK